MGFALINKIPLGELSKSGPCLTTFNNSLALAWFGTDNEFNLLLSTDGQSWSGKRTFGGPGVGPPAIGTGGSGVAAPTQLLAWRNPNNGDLLIEELLVNGEGNGNATGQTTDYAPALSANYIAWTGSGNPQLNVATCQPGQQGEGYVPSVSIVGKIVSSESSDGGPCLCDFNGEPVIGWRGSGNNTLNVALLVGNNIVNKKVIGEYSDDGPSLASVGTTLYMAFKGSGNPQLNIMSSTGNYSSWGVPTVLSDASDSGPSLHTYNNVLYIAWRGLGNNELNIARVTGPGLS